MTSYQTLKKYPMKPEGRLATCPKCFCGKSVVEVQAYWIVNILAAILHLVNAALMLIFYYWDDNKQDKLYDIATVYDNYNNHTITKETITIWEDFSLHWTVFTFHLLSFVFQMIVLFPGYNYQTKVEKEGRNWLRYVEYSASASLMLVSIALTVGIKDFITLLVICILNISTQVIGAFNETTARPDIRRGGFFLAWGCILSAYFIILWYYGLSVVHSEDSISDETTLIVISQFVLFNLFGFVQMVQIFGNNWGFLSAIGKESELSYCILSIVSKTALGWLIYNSVINP
jgi:hypothetical protein